MTTLSTQFVSKTHCRLGCGGTLRTIVPFPNTPIGDAYQSDPDRAKNLPFFELNLSLCPTCGHLQIKEVVEPDILYGNFTYRTRVSLGLVEHFENYANQVQSKLSLPKDSFILDIGSNDGSLLKFFQNQGHRVLGIDPATDVAQEANDNGVETWPVYFDQESAGNVLKEKGQADLVVSNNTFANIDDLTGFFALVKKVLHPKASFIFETGYAIDLAGKLIIDNIYHEHLSYFLVNPLADFFDRQGMILYDIEKIDTKGGSIRGYVATKDSGKQASGSLRELIRVENERGLSKPEAFEELNGKIHSAKSELKNQIEQVKREGGKVVGYGASVGVTTMLYHFDIGEDLDYLVDENRIKHGLFSPGFGLEVFSHKKLLDDMPACTVILAWRYAEPIIAKNIEYLHRGGSFVIPLPTPQTITAADVR